MALTSSGPFCANQEPNLKASVIDKTLSSTTNVNVANSNCSDFAQSMVKNTEMIWNAGEAMHQSAE